MCQNERKNTRHVIPKLNVATVYSHLSRRPPTFSHLSTMISFHQPLRMLLPTILLLLIAARQIESFQLGPKLAQTNKPAFQISPDNHLGLVQSSPFISPTQLYAKKKQEEPVKEQQTNPVELLITYMTPWRNPNSIFVYLFLGVYLLGKYSEAKIQSGGTL